MEENDYKNQKLQENDFSRQLIFYLQNTKCPITILIDMSYKENFFSPARTMSFFALLVLITASVMSFNHTPSIYVVFPKPEIFVFAINLLCTVCCVFSIVYPKDYRLQCKILFVQGITTALTNFAILGIFLYDSFIILLFCNGGLKTKTKQKLSIIFGIWFVVCMLYGYECYINYHKYWIYLFLLQILLTAFSFSFYMCIYKKLESLLIPLVPQKKITCKNIDLPEPGNEIELSRLGLTSRQAELVKEYLKSQSSYEELSKKFFISKSTVKKDMADTFVKFGVSNIKELHILLIQYVIK